MISSSLIDIKLIRLSILSCRTFGSWCRRKNWSTTSKVLTWYCSVFPCECVAVCWDPILNSWHWDFLHCAYVAFTLTGKFIYFVAACSGSMAWKVDFHLPQTVSHTSQAASILRAKQQEATWSVSQRRRLPVIGPHHPTVTAATAKAQLLTQPCPRARQASRNRTSQEGGMSSNTGPSRPHFLLLPSMDVPWSCPLRTAEAQHFTLLSVSQKIGWTIKRKKQPAPYQPFFAILVPL